MGTGRFIRFREEIFMRRGRVWYTAAITLVMMTGLFTITSFAAKGEKITAIKLEVKDNLQLGSALDEEDELEIETSADSYGVAEWEIDNECFTWNSEHKPRVKVTVTADDDYYFSVSKDKVKIKGDSAKVVSTKKEDSQTLIITLDLKPMAERVGPIEYAYLNGTVATWAPAQGAVAYELYLYRDSKAVGARGRPPKQRMISEQPSEKTGSTIIKCALWAPKEARKENTRSRQVGMSALLWLRPWQVPVTAKRRTATTGIPRDSGCRMRPAGAGSIRTVPIR